MCGVMLANKLLGLGRPNEPDQMGASPAGNGAPGGRRVSTELELLHHLQTHSSALSFSASSSEEPVLLTAILRPWKERTVRATKGSAKSVQ